MKIFALTVRHTEFRACVQPAVDTCVLRVGEGDVRLNPIRNPYSNRCT